MIRLLVSAMLLTALALAGCSNGGDASPDGTPTTTGGGGPGGEPGMINQPAWQIGQFWRYRDAAGAEATVVVTAGDGTSWTLSTNSPDLAFQDALHDVTALGIIRTQDHAIRQGEAWIQILDWPLEDGKTWQTEFSGTPMTMNATGEPDGTFLVAGASTAGRLEVRYDPSIGWLRSIKEAHADGRTYEWTVTGTGAAYQGTIATWTLETIADSTSQPGQSPGASFGPFDVTAGTTDLWAHYKIACTTGVFTSTLQPASGAQTEAFRVQVPCPAAFEQIGPVVVAPAAGQWLYESNRAMTDFEARELIFARALVEAAFPVQ